MQERRQKQKDIPEEFYGPTAMIDKSWSGPSKELRPGTHVTIYLSGKPESREMASKQEDSLFKELATTKLKTVQACRSPGSHTHTLKSIHLHSHLAKADIFALGLTIYEAAGGGPLPKNGDEWHDIRAGKLKHLKLYTSDFNELIKQMIHQNPEMRPSATSLIQHRVICPFGNKTKAQLRRELNAEKLKNEILAKQLATAEKCFKALPPNIIQQFAGTPSEFVESRRSLNNKTSRLIGKKVNRSHSTTSF
ncbi:hypothetical protein L9F63_013745 [Diploptera punctata]|uniref:Protein kinase domain-containing protein n=1 Tax=Diploptera punctata TaxID=6984 RepID=A0AAD8AA86_DIPPU|nr:hypothetical protein L9F63_013745 [Diploptera punctata]